MDEAPNKSLVFLPWAEYKEEVTFGKIAIYPFNERLVQEKRISDRFFRYLNEYFQQFVRNRRGRPRNGFGTIEQDKPIGPVQSDVSVVAYEQKFADFFADGQAPYPVDEILDSVTLVSLLATWDLTDGQTGMYLWSFTPQSWEARCIQYTPSPDSQTGIVEESSGGYIRTSSIMPTGLAIETRPRATRGESCDTHAHGRDGDFLRYANLALLDYARVSQEGWFRRMIRAIRICNRSLTNAEFHDQYEMIGEMILIICSALSLFCGGWEKRKFREGVAGLLGRDSESDNKGGKALRDFLDDLYEIRSKYAHGESPDAFRCRIDKCIEKHGDPYVQARHIFGLCCKAQLRKMLAVPEERAT